MKTGKVLAIAAAGALVAAPAVAQTAAPLSVAHALDVRADESSDLRGNRSAAMVLGFVLLVAIIAVALSNGEGPAPPASP